MGAKKRRILSLPVAAVISLMTTVYYTTIFIFLQDWMGLTTPNGILNALIFTFSAITGLIAFFVAVLTDPGRVPFAFAPEAEDPQKDHHCVWISNCVGFANYKAFIIFIFHAAIGSIYSTVIFCCSVTQKDLEIQKRTVKLYYVLYGTVTGGLSLTTGSLLAWHIYLLIHNMTTIEYREGVRAKWLARKSGQSYRHPFDLGVYSNLIAVLGPSMMKWLCPIAVGHLRDGTQFPISDD